MNANLILVFVDILTLIVVEGLEQEGVSNRDVDVLILVFVEDGRGDHRQQGFSGRMHYRHLVRVVAHLVKTSFRNSHFSVLFVHNFSVLNLSAKKENNCATKVHSYERIPNRSLRASKARTNK